MIDTLYRFAKFQYECGNYSGAAEYLYFVRVLVCLSVATQEIFPLTLWTLSILAAANRQEIHECIVGKAGIGNSHAELGSRHR